MIDSRPIVVRIPTRCADASSDLQRDAVESTRHRSGAILPHDVDEDRGEGDDSVV
jgi:hypothetical protein